MPKNVQQRVKYLVITLVYLFLSFFFFVSLTEVQDVVFRLGYFERSDIFLSWQQLARDLQWHYT